MKRLGTVFGLSLFLLLLAGVSLLPKTASAESTNIWNENLLVEEIGSISSSEIRERYDCDYKNATIINLNKPYSYIFPGIPNLNSINKNNIGKKCIIKNSSGVFTNAYGQGIGDEFLSSMNYGPNTSHMFTLWPKLPNNVWLEPASQSKYVFVFSKKTYYHSSYTVYQYSDFGAGRPIVSRNNLTWEFGATPNERWKDNAGLSFMINEHAFSSNGNYMVIRYGSNGIVAKVDLNTLEMTPVHKNTAGNYDIAISNDGKFVAVLSGKDLRVINTSGCETTYKEGDWLGFYGFSTFPGCISSTNLISAAVSSGFDSDNKRYERPYFDTKNKGLFIGEGSFIDGMTYDGTAFGHYDWRELKFTAEENEVSVEGYLALGDSFSSGEGDMEGDEWYESGTDEQGNAETFEGRNLCHLSRRSYPYLMAVNLGYLANNLNTPPSDGLFHSVACSGAVARNIIGGSERGVIDYPANGSAFEDADNQYRNDYFENLDRWQPGRIKQLDFINNNVFGGYTNAELPLEAITVGIGGNDAGFGDIILSCIKPGTCKYAAEGSLAASELAQTIASLKDTLSETYKSVKNASPDSRVYVHGYPVFVQGYDGNCGINTPLNAEETVFVEKGVRYMNSVVKAAALEAGVFYVDVSDILQGRNLCSGVEDSLSAFNGATQGNDKLSLFDNKITEAVSGLYMIGNNCYFTSGCIGNESFHPNHMGHELYAEEILNQTDNLTASMPEPSPQPYPSPDSFFGNLAIEHITRVNESNGYITDYDVVIKQPKSFLSYKDQDTVAILQSGLYPGSTIVVSHQSEPTNIGQFVADENGVLQEDIVLPQTLTDDPGEHEIHIEGLDSFGNPVNYYQPITIAFSAEDFDGDGVLNELDSCITLENSLVDEDQDGIDDVCDSEILTTNTEEQQQEENNGFMGFEKGETNPETVAGNEQTNNQAVLGDSTSISSAQVMADANTLSNAGMAAIAVSLVGVSIMSFVLLINTKKAAQD